MNELNTLEGLAKRLTKLEKRMDKFERLVTTLATKDDLKRFATKTDLNSLDDKLEKLIGFAETTDRHLTVLIAGGKTPDDS